MNFCSQIYLYVHTYVQLTCNMLLLAGTDIVNDKGSQRAEAKITYERMSQIFIIGTCVLPRGPRSEEWADDNRQNCITELNWMRQQTPPCAVRHVTQAHRYTKCSNRIISCSKRSHKTAKRVCNLHSYLAFGVWIVSVADASDIDDPNWIFILP